MFFFSLSTADVGKGAVSLINREVLHSPYGTTVHPYVYGMQGDAGRSLPPLFKHTPSPYAKHLNTTS